MDTNMTQEAAVARYEGYLRQDPNNGLLLMSLGDLYHRAGKLAEALSCYEKCLAGKPDHATAQRQRANVMLSQHRFADAEQVLRALIDNEHPEPALLHNLGLALYYQKRWGEALQAFGRARELGLQNAQNLIYNAYALHQQGQVREALELCQAWLAEHPQQTIEGYVALLEMDSGDLTAANRRAEEVLKQQPENADAALVASMWSIEQQDMEQALRHVDTVLQAQPGSPRAWFAKGLVHMFRQQHGEAIAAIETALSCTPGHVGTIVTLAWARFAARDIRGAERSFRQAIAADGSFAEAHGGLAVTLIFQNRPQEARREAQIARRLNPNSLGAVWARGSLLALGGEQQAGEALVAAALQRPLTADGKTMFDHIQRFARQQAARSDGAPKKPL